MAADRPAQRTLEGPGHRGEDPNQALAEVLVAKEAWVAAARDAGRPIPQPRYRPALYAH